jgi:hypothetical protein
MAQAEAEYPDWLSHLLTHPVAGLENFAELFEKLSGAKEAIKVYCEVAVMEKEQSWAQSVARAS